MCVAWQRNVSGPKGLATCRGLPCSKAQLARFEERETFATLRTACCNIEMQCICVCRTIVLIARGTPRQELEPCVRPCRVADVHECSSSTRLLQWLVTAEPAGTARDVPLTAVTTCEARPTRRGTCLDMTNNKDKGATKSRPVLQRHCPGIRRRVARQINRLTDVSEEPAASIFAVQEHVLRMVQKTPVDPALVVPRVLPST
jgi:hypothetical protein